MRFDIDDAKFQQILDLTVGPQPIEPRELRAIVQLAQLAAWIDLDDDPAERTLVQALTKRLCAWGGLAMDSITVLSPVPTDDEERTARIAELARQLTTSGARELGFVLAYLVIIVDLELAPVESALLEQFQDGLAIPRARADDLVEAISRIVTPGSASLPDPEVMTGER
ncbi:MAG TPA: hypothetical protein VHN14_37375 [Kofleriaceae bacterium]|jgi:hypothetical protein|nr:hypothetical protein [Kofleriaceae bacterium]